MARHAHPSPQRRALLQAGLAVTAVGAALAAGAGAAQAAPAVPPPAAPTAPDQVLLGALQQSASSGLGPVTHMRLDPLAGTEADPLNNAVGTQVADFKPVSTEVVTGAISQGGALKDLPLAGPATQLLPH
ncbi:hypothetical protein ACFYVL_12430 [Streptomyces sp. NPDC004111]|uniref:hypothetical protein n=1 Tax=Streptomyces sp. NPDC004111 TaxID=3364690 RepID=UPI0036A07564